MNVNIVVAIIVVFVVYFGACQEDLCFMNSKNDTETYIVQKYNDAVKDKSVKDYLVKIVNDAMILINLCASVSGSNPVNLTINNTFYMCETLDLSKNVTVSCTDNDYCVKLDPTLVDSYSDWQCTDTDTCDGLKVGLVLSDDIVQKYESASSVGYAYILNPETNCIINCIDPSYISIVFSINNDDSATTQTAVTSTFTTPTVMNGTYNGTYNVTQYNVTQYNVTQYNVTQYNVTQYNVTQYNVTQYNVTQYNVTYTNGTNSNTNDNITTTTTTITTIADYRLQCFQLDPKTLSWETNNCNKTESNYTLNYLECSCPGPFPIGVFRINEDVVGKTIDFEPLSESCIILTTTAEPVTSTTKTVTNMTTTSVPGNTTTTTLNPKYAVVKCKCSFSKPYDSNDETSVCEACQNQFNLTSDTFQSCTTSNGSTIVAFQLIGDADTIDKELADIQSIIKSGKLIITINGTQYVASNDSFSFEYKVKPTQPSTPLDDGDDGLTDAEIAITVVCVVIGVLGIIIIGVFCYISHKKKHKQRPVSPSDSTGPIVAEEKHHKHSSNDKHAKGRHNPAFEEEH